MEGRAKIIEKPGHFFTRIHQSDITDITQLRMAHYAGRILNLCDHEPAPQGDVDNDMPLTWLGVAPPTPVAFEDANLSPMARTFYVSRRRLASKYVGKEIPVTLTHPTYREGLRGFLLKATRSPKLK